MTPPMSGLVKRFKAPLAVVTHLILVAASGVRSQVLPAAPTTPRQRFAAPPATAPSAPLAPSKAALNASRGPADPLPQALPRAANSPAGLASATTGAQTLRTVDAALCKPFLVKGLFVSGCTDIDSPQGSEPWCVIGTEKVLCDRNTIPERSGRPPDSPNDSAPCDFSTVVANRGTVYGCFAFATENGAPVKCKSGDLGLLPCLSLKAQVSGPASSESNSAPKAALIAGIAAGVAIPLALGLVFVFYRRRGRGRKRVGASAVSRGYKDVMTPTSNISSPVDAGDPLPVGGGGGGGGGGGMARARVSSQYFNDARATLIDDRGSDVTRRLPTSLGKYVIAATYSPTLDDEINIQPGDIVEVYQEFDDGWCSAVNLSRGLTRGVFPMHCIDERVGRIDDNFQPSPRPR